MFKSDRSAKCALIVLMLMVLFTTIGTYLEGRFDHVLMGLGLLLIFVWAFLNPWILQIKYSILLTLDFERMQHTSIVVAGLVIFFASVLLMLR